MTKPNKKAAWVEDLSFVFEECARVHELISNTPPGRFKDLPRSDVSGDLPHPSGRGQMACSAAAIWRVRRLAEQALANSDAVGTLEPERVYRAFRTIIVDRFMKGQVSVDERNVEKAMAAAVKIAKRNRADTVHYFPCRLMYTAKPDSFTIGPVTFMTTAQFNQRMADKFEAYACGDGLKDMKTEECLLEDARHYYDGFTWIGQVEVLNCDDGISKMRGQLAVTAALNFIHVIFGSYHTDRMMVGGPRRENDRRAHITMTPDGEIDVSGSWSATSAVGFHEGWEDLLQKETAPLLISAAGKALEPIRDPAVKRPLATRLTDAVGWFGDAVREESAAAQIVKAVTALEALVMTDEREEIAAEVSARATALCFDPERDSTFEEVNTEMSHAYDIRSRLAHGSLSPFDAEVTQYAPQCLYWAERAIGGALVLFESYGLLDRDLSRNQLKEGMARLIEAAKQLSGEKSKPSEDTKNGGRSGE
ncbi:MULTISPECIES: HEPN domain-containing protein [unclassified Bradyrhizobium]|uniref:HEPN domain-containing protein n=1 Tax=unclassified Bradyrhizobium TaxID=2631580 RepID=UPI002916D94C|nr:MULTISPECIES: HEPN domain-containing protein [unclassified Bradyrhizobium]